MLKFAGLDGTVLKQDVFDLLIFFAGAYPAFGSIQIEDNGDSTITYDEKYLEHGVGVSSVLPGWHIRIPA